MLALRRQVDELHAALVPDYFRAGPTVPGVPSRVTRRAAPSPDPLATVLVADKEARRGAPTVIGAVWLRVYDTPDDPTMVPRRRAHVEALVVDTHHRRAGVGTSLMQAADAWARARGALDVVLTVWSGNLAAEAFYERLGYRLVSRALGRAL